MEPEAASADGTTRHDTARRGTQLFTAHCVWRLAATPHTSLHYTGPSTWLATSRHKTHPSHGLRGPTLPLKQTHSLRVNLARGSGSYGVTLGV